MRRRRIIAYYSTAANTWHWWHGTRRSCQTAMRLADPTAAPALWTIGDDDESVMRWHNDESRCDACGEFINWEDAT